MTDRTKEITLEVTVARTLDQVVMAMTLRGVIYLGEQEAPYGEEYDGNDLVGASHLIAWKGKEPVSGQTVVVSRLSPPRVRKEGVTNSDGYYEVVGLGAGEIDVLAELAAGEGGTAPGTSPRVAEGRGSLVALVPPLLGVC